MVNQHSQEKWALKVPRVTPIYFTICEVLLKMKKSNNLKRRGPMPKRQPQIKSIERMEHPPQINAYQNVHGQTLRFTVTAAVVNTGVTNDDILDACLVADTAVHGFQLFDAFKIKRIEIWGQAALGTPSTVECQFVENTGDVGVHTDTSLGVKPAYLSCRPSLRSLASFWNITGGNNIFVFTAPAGSIIDLHLAFRTSTAAPTALQNALVGANPGEFYFRGLDGLAIATTNLPPPVGVNTR